eukprot:295125-Pelagomonas_calceolata.AAC.6
MHLRGVDTHRHYAFSPTPRIHVAIKHALTQKLDHCISRALAQGLCDNVFHLDRGVYGCWSWLAGARQDTKVQWLTNLRVDGKQTKQTHDTLLQRRKPAAGLALYMSAVCKGASGQT